MGPTPCQTEPPERSHKRPDSAKRMRGGEGPSACIQPLQRALPLYSEVPATREAATATMDAPTPLAAPVNSSSENDGGREEKKEGGSAMTVAMAR
eukprot:4960474-Pyramimonas_sp.AAC.1